MTEWYGTNARAPDGHVEGGPRAAVPSRGVSAWLLGTLASPRPPVTRGHFVLATHNQHGPGWYFKWPRVIVTGPILLVAGANLVYYLVMFPLIEIDLLIGNLVAWFFFGQAVFGFLSFIAVALSWAPIVLLPILWDSPRIWGIAKIGIYSAGFMAVLFATGFVSGFTLTLLEAVATLRTTVWWAELWGADRATF